MEYASENEQLKLYNFFNEIISGLPDGKFMMINLFDKVKRWLECRDYMNFTEEVERLETFWQLNIS